MRRFIFQLAALGALLIAAPACAGAMASAGGFQEGGLLLSSRFTHAAQESLGEVGGQGFAGWDRRQLSCKLGEYFDARFGARASSGASAEGANEFAGLAKSVSNASSFPALSESGALLLLGGGMCALAVLLRWRRIGESQELEKTSL